MKIAFIGLRGIPTSYGGIERHVEELATRLVERGHEVTVYCMSRYTQRIQHKGVKLIRLPSIRQRHLEMISYAVLATLHLVFDSTVDVVHYQSVEIVLLAFPLKLSIPVVATSHGPAYRRIEKWGGIARKLIEMLELGFIYLPDARITVARFLQKFYQEKYSCETVFIPNGVTVRDIVGRQILERLDLKDEGYILYVGRLVASKGCHTLIRAYKQLIVAHNLECKLVIVGDINHPNTYIQSLLRERSEKILFTGYLEGDDLWQLYKYCTVFAFPSIVEALPMVLLEAMSFGVPVVYANIEESRSIADGKAYSFESGNELDLAQKILHVIEHRQEAFRLAEETRQEIADEYDWDVIVDKTEQIYTRVLKARRGILKTDQTCV